MMMMLAMDGNFELEVVGHLHLALKELVMSAWGRGETCQSTVRLAHHLGVSFSVAKLFFCKQNDTLGIYCGSGCQQ